MFLQARKCCHLKTFFPLSPSRFSCCLSLSPARNAGLRGPPQPLAWVSETLWGGGVIKIAAVSYRSLLNCQLIIKIVQNLGNLDCWAMDPLGSLILPTPRGVLTPRWRPVRDYIRLQADGRGRPWGPASPTAEPGSGGKQD